MIDAVSLFPQNNNINKLSSSDEATHTVKKLTKSLLNQVKGVHFQHWMQ